MPTKTEYQKYAIAYLREWEKKLSLREAYQLAVTIKEWDKLSKMFESLILELSKKTNLTPDKIFRLSQYKEFMSLSKEQSIVWANKMTLVTSAGQREFAQAGYTVSQTLLTALKVEFTKLPIEAISKGIGITSEGSPLFDIFKKRFDDNANKASDILLEGIARGLNPNTTAKLMRDKLNINVYESTRITRTEQLNIYRDISYQSYVESGIVTGYEWLAEDSACSECLDRESNNPYPLDTKPESLHPFDECSLVPVL